MIQTEQNGE